ncbi:MAG: hypothetical protein ABW213_00680 [Tardiphaga sp.]
MITRDAIKPLTYVFEDDGLVPNSRLPMLIYKHAIDLPSHEPEAAIETMFARNGWGETWRNGIFDYMHYHATVHEVLGIARGHAMVLFGGEVGDAIEVRAGDVVVLPAGTGHKRLFATHDFRVVGAYPPGQKMHVTQPSPVNYRKSLLMIPKVKVPETDPVFGEHGPLMRLWKNA